MAAVELVKARLVFGKENFGVQDANLTVPQGTIYALLGPSGCGKTTLLNFIVGLKRVQSGKVSVFGHAPHSKGAGVPGPWLGYMPQDLCLCDELTVEETITYFGLLNCLPKTYLGERVMFLKTMLELPEGRKAGKMSGGQRRRLSLAVAMVHDPSLLILDEPTVGVDPLLRTVIWKHLLHLANNLGKTVLITTHYIEEASAAHVVGFMRDGRILEEDNPQLAMKKYQAGSLEEVFLKLCRSIELQKEVLMLGTDKPSCSSHGPRAFSRVSPSVQGSPSKTQCDLCLEEYESSGSSPSHKKTQSAVNSAGTLDESPGITNLVYEEDPEDLEGAQDSPPKTTELPHKEASDDHSSLPSSDNYATPPSSNNASPLSVDEFITAQSSYSASPNKQRMKMMLPEPKAFWISSMIKIYAITWKNMLITRRNMVLLVISFLTPVTNLLMCKLLLFKTPYGIPVAVVNNDSPPTISQRLIDAFDNTTLALSFYDSLDDALKLQKELKLKGIIHIQPEFSISMIRRVQQGLRAQNETIFKTFVHLYVDRTNMELERTIYNSLMESYAKLSEEYVELWGIEKKATQSPLTFEKPVIGPEKPELSDYMIMNMLPDSLFIMALAFAVLVFMADISSGISERGFVSGVKDFQVVASHLVIHSLVTTVQIVFLFTFLLSFRYEVKGGYALICFLLYQASFLGMALGILLVSVNCKVSNAVLAVVTVYWFSGTISGLMWPPEGHPPVVGAISKIHPCTWNYRAVRLVVYKALGIDSNFIWPSVLLTLAWTMGLLCVSIFLLQKDKSRLLPKMPSLRRKKAPRPSQ